MTSMNNFFFQTIIATTLLLSVYVARSDVLDDLLSIPPLPSPSPPPPPPEPSAPACEPEPPVIVPRAPEPQPPAPQAPGAQPPAPQAPGPQPPTPQAPGPQPPTSQAPGPQPPAPQAPGPQPPAPQAPTPQAPGPQPPASQAPGPQPPAPQAPGPQPPVTPQPDEKQVVDIKGNAVQERKNYKMLMYGTTEGVGVVRKVPCPFYVAVKRPIENDPNSIDGIVELTFHSSLPPSQEDATIYERDYVGIEFKGQLFRFLQLCDDTLGWDVRDTTVRTGSQFRNTRFRIIKANAGADNNVYTLRFCPPKAVAPSCQDIGTRVNSTISDRPLLVFANSVNPLFKFQLQPI